MKHKIFIDGKEGTTGLKIMERFANRNDVTILEIEESKRKDVAQRKKLINSADIVFLCLPDVAAVEAVSLVEYGNKVKIIDASTAHRINSEWSYGFPELSLKHREKVANATRVAVPGCHASGFIGIVYPLVQLGILPADYSLVCHSITGYSGGGKSMIAAYQADNRSVILDSPRQYGLSLKHKHLPEMKHVTGIFNAPIFNPIVADYYSGMTVTVPLYLQQLKRKISLDDLRAELSNYYNDAFFVQVMSQLQPNDGLLCANDPSVVGTNRMELWVYGNDEQACVAARFDNLGKGASGAAVQCMNIMLGIDEKVGLI